MTPIATTGEGKGDHSVIFQSSRNTTITEPSRKKWRVRLGVVLGLVTMVIIATTVVLVVYFGHRMTSECYGDVLQTFPTKDGDGVEEIVHDTDEETKVIVPNKLKVIHNWKHNLTIYRVFQSKMNKFGNCVAFPANDTRPDGEVTTEGVRSNVRYRKSNVIIASHVISEGVFELCGEEDIVVMERITLAMERVKRGFPCVDTGALADRVKRQYTCTEVFSHEYYRPIRVPKRYIYSYYWYFNYYKYFGKVVVDFTLYSCDECAPYEYAYDISCTFMAQPGISIGPYSEADD